MKHLFAWSTFGKAASRAARSLPFIATKLGNFRPFTCNFFQDLEGIMPLLARISQTALGAGETSLASAVMERSKEKSSPAAPAAADTTVTGDGAPEDDS